MIATKIKALREEKRYSQEYVATVLNITQASYSRIESGKIKPCIEKLMVLCLLYNIALNEITREGS